MKAGDSFSVFLESVRQDKASKKAGGAPYQLAEILAEHGGSMAVPELYQASGLDFDCFSQALLKMRKQDLVALSSQDGKESVGLTEAGSQIVALAQAVR